VARQSPGLSVFGRRALYQGIDGSPLNPERRQARRGTTSTFPAEALDQDEVFEARGSSTLAIRKFVFTIGKAWRAVERLDRKTGGYVSHQGKRSFRTSSTGLIRRPGKPCVSRRHHRRQSERLDPKACPSTEGRSHNWQGDELQTSRLACPDHSAEPVVHGNAGARIFKKVGRIRWHRSGPKIFSRCPARTATSEKLVCLTDANTMKDGCGAKSSAPGVF